MDDECKSKMSKCIYITRLISEEKATKNFYDLLLLSFAVTLMENFLAI